MNPGGHLLFLYLRPGKERTIVSSLNLKKENKMSKKTPSIFHKTLMLCFIFALCSTQIYPRIWCNTTDGGFTDDEVLAGFSMKTHIVEAAAHFLNAYGHTMLLLNKIELSELYGLNFTEAQQLTNIAIEEMNYAIAEFSSLRELAAKTPYNDNVLDLVAAYDFAQFESRKKANASILGNLKDLLVQKKLREYYDQIQTNLYEIVGHLNLLKSHLDGNIYPDFEAVHNLNQVLAETMISGEYAAEIFHEVIDNTNK